MSGWARLAVGPFGARRCQACGTPLAASRLSLLIALGLFALMMLGFLTLPIDLAFLVFTLILVADRLVDLFVVPLRVT
jgi:hypothetical protein